MRLGDYLDKLCWSQADLARKAKVSAQSVARALRGEKITRITAAKIVAALSKALGKPLGLDDIEWLQVAPLHKRRRRSAPGDQQEEKPVKPVKQDRKQSDKTM